jgi:hypothetical protein
MYNYVAPSHAENLLAYVKLWRLVESVFIKLVITNEANEHTLKQVQCYFQVLQVRGRGTYMSSNCNIPSLSGGTAPTK